MNLSHVRTYLCTVLFNWPVFYEKYRIVGTYVCTVLGGYEIK